MPSVIEQLLDENELYIKFTNGYEFRRTREELNTLRTERGKVQALLDLRNELRSNLGPLMDAGKITLDFENTDGRPRTLLLTD